MAKSEGREKLAFAVGTRLDAVAFIVTRQGKTHRHPIGAGFVNDGSIGVVLNSLPLDGRFHLLPMDRRHRASTDDTKDSAAIPDDADIQKGPARS